MVGVLGFMELQRGKSERKMMHIAVGFSLPDRYDSFWNNNKKRVALEMSGSFNVDVCLLVFRNNGQIISDNPSEWDHMGHSKAYISPDEQYLA